MKGFGIIKTNEFGWIEKDKPVAGPLDAILRPLCLAPCTSDIHVGHGGAGDKKNLIIGHEAVGEIVEVGDCVRLFKPGDVVVVPAITPDWMAPGVQEGFSSHDIGLMGGMKFITAKDGSMAEYFHVNQADANLVLLPEGVKPEAALMTVDMMTTGFYGAEMANICFGDTVAIIGIGPVGLMAVAGAALRGASRIIAVGTRPNCVKIAQEYGATDIISYKKGDIVEQITTLCDGGVDRTIIAGGNASTFTQAIAMTRVGGNIANVNFFDVSDTLSMKANFWGLGMSDKTIRGGFCPGGALRIKKLLDLIKYGRVDVTKLITHTFHGFDKIEDAARLMDDKTPDLIKPVVFID
jgi:threonine dehydrogenase-like Zn-dependent dehydrogenase